MKNKKACPGCSEALRDPEVMNSLSRYDHGYICNNCGMREAFEGDFITKEKNTPISQL